MQGFSGDVKNGPILFNLRVNKISKKLENSALKFIEFVK